MSTLNQNKHIPHYKKAISLCLLVVTLCSSTLAQDCVTVYEDVFCVENFSHEKLTRAIELIVIEPDKNDPTEIQLQISIAKEKLMRLMQWTEHDMRAEVKKALSKLKNDEIQDIISKLNNRDTQNAYGIYWNLQLIYENDLLMKKMFPFFYKCAHDPKVREAYNNFHNRYGYINTERTIQVDSLSVKEYQAKAIEIIEHISHQS